MKTTNEILTDVINAIKASPINDLSGSIYKGSRPEGSMLEDAVVRVFSGVNGKFMQNSSVSVMVFYNDIETEGNRYEDTARGQILEKMLFDLSLYLYDMTGYSFFLESRETYTAKVEELNQHYAILKINFQTLI